MAARTRDPRTKEELLDRMLSFDFDGDIRHLGAEPAKIVRTAPNRLELTFPDTGRTYELVARIPREEKPEPARQRSQETRSFGQPEARDDDLTTVHPQEREERQPRQRTGRAEARR